MPEPERASTSAGNSQRSCLGLEFYSTYRLEHKKQPLCGGFKRRPRQQLDPSLLQGDVVPGERFNHFCLGYSFWDIEKLRGQASSERKPQDGGDVELPVCQGLELIVAAKGQETPVVVGEGAGVASAGAPAAAPKQTIRQRPLYGGRELPRGRDGREALAHFSKRFGETSRRIVRRMQTNADFLAASVKEAYRDATERRDK